MLISLLVLSYKCATSVVPSNSEQHVDYYYEEDHCKKNVEMFTSIVVLKTTCIFSNKLRCFAVKIQLVYGIKQISHYRDNLVVNKH